MWTLLVACSPSGTLTIDDATEPPGPSDPATTGPTAVGEPEEPEPDERLPVLFVHGINGAAENWDSTRDHLAEDGWPADQLYARTFADPEWGCNNDNADTIDQWVGAILDETGAEQLTLVAHSMGTLSSRYYLKNLGGTDLVNRYVTLGGMHHGLLSSCSPDFPFKPCVWDELCATGEFVAQLNAPPATPGDLEWISIYGTADDTVPNASSELDGAENIAIAGVTHDGPDGLQETAATYASLREVLERPSP
jgi:triacylglycerol lipase